eukprot:CAMPEP_0174954044 /NCGR_PEP_ID=MMETSP0004_2-20121128/205_1 /TAXON_ID=420556 /ORGANISM="Ochromonas sp., Strain CCMP1393" /LENGTH=787 /DNA_ID=CAMNT_0016201813 /DNA_START=43 /DNA_END=2407 /DNA_ORIENTATION=-
MDLNVKVAVRCRPMSSKETARGCNDIITITPTSVTIKGVEANHEDKEFTFDHCYGADSLQTAVYNDLGTPIVQQALDGFNGTIFAYGQTGSGKSFSMMGTDELKGIIPQLNDDLFEKVALKLGGKPKRNNEILLTVSFLEVYNEEIKDLLNPSTKKLKIHEMIVRDSSDLMRLIYQGNAVRRVAATKMNDQSSRSHSVFTIKVEHKTTTELPGGVTREQTVKAKINLVDLAGSERASKTGAAGQTLKEGANINLSLMALGNVINMLSEGAARNKKKVIPYRDSKLTRLLQESLGGNAATVMIAAISPADYNYSETMSTLKYANRAKSIENAVTRNEDNNERMIRDLKQQIEELKKKLESGEAAAGGGTPDPELEVKLKEMEAAQADAWEEKEKLAKALEAERQSNMNNVISEMMNGVKDQKVQHMKNIKRLTNEKAMLSKNFKEVKDFNTKLKGNLDKSIQQYQVLQKAYDTLDAEVQATADVEGSEGDAAYDEAVRVHAEKQAEAEAMAQKMIELLTTIENSRLQYTEKRDNLKRIKQRLDAIEDEITDERAELVATAGLLNQNDKLREQIQQEERDKMKIEFEAEMRKAKDKLDEERKNVRETVSTELEQQMEKLQSEIKLLKSLLEAEEKKSLEMTERHKQAHEYGEKLEQRLVDSQVEQEEVQLETVRLKEEITALQEQLAKAAQREAALQGELDNQKKDSVNSVETYKEDAMKKVEEAKFQMFKQLMDAFEEERKVMEKAHQQTQSLLSQAAKDVLFLTQKNGELQSQLTQAMYYEPPIQHR